MSLTCSVFTGKSLNLFEPCIQAAANRPARSHLMHKCKYNINVPMTVIAKFDEPFGGVWTYTGAVGL